MFSKGGWVRNKPVAANVLHEELNLASLSRVMGGGVFDLFRFS